MKQDYSRGMRTNYTEKGQSRRQQIICRVYEDSMVKKLLNAVPSYPISITMIKGNHDHNDRYPTPIQCANGNVKCQFVIVYSCAPHHIMLREEPHEGMNPTASPADHVSRLELYVVQ